LAEVAPKEQLVNITLMKDYQVRTALMKAARDNKVGLVVSLLDQGAAIDVQDAGGNTPLLSSVQSANGSEVFVELMRRGANFNVMNNVGDTALFSAIQYQKWDIALRLVRLNASIGVGTDAWDRMVQAVRTGLGPEVVAQLARTAGSDFTNLQNEFGWTPLMQFCKYHMPTLGKAIIHGGADLDVRDSTGGSALHICAWEGQKELSRVILDEGYSVNVQKANGQTPLMSQAPVPFAST